MVTRISVYIRRAVYVVHCTHVFICEYKCIVIKQALYNYNPLLT